MDFSLLNNAVLRTFGDRLPITIDGVPFDAIYDSRHYEAEDGEAGSSDLITSISVRSEDLPDVSDATIIVARGVSYRAWDKRPDGEGMTTLILERRS
jgi:hypothetical protein